jgi:hypothetical protein
MQRSGSMKSVMSAPLLTRTWSIDEIDLAPNEIGKALAAAL